MYQQRSINEDICLSTSLSYRSGTIRICHSLRFIKMMLDSLYPIRLRIMWETVQVGALFSRTIGK